MIILIEKGIPVRLLKLKAQGPSFCGPGRGSNNVFRWWLHFSFLRKVSSLSPTKRGSPRDSSYLLWKIKLIYSRNSNTQIIRMGGRKSVQKAKQNKTKQTPNLWRIPNQPLLLVSWINFSKLLNLSGPWFSHL